MGRVFGGAKPAPAPTVTPNPVVTPKAAVQIGDNIDGEKKGYLANLPLGVIQPMEPFQNESFLVDGVPPLCTSHTSPNVVSSHPFGISFTLLINASQF